MFTELSKFDELFFAYPKTYISVRPEFSYKALCEALGLQQRERSVVFDVVRIKKFPKTSKSILVIDLNGDESVKI